MRSNRRFWIAGAGLSALALTGSFHVQAQQDPAPAAEPRQREAAHAERAGGHETNMLVAHGLAMAIEGNTLQALARRSTYTTPVGMNRRASGETTGLAGNPAVGNTGGEGASGSGAGLTTDPTRPAPGATATAVQSDAELMRHANSAYEASDRLLRQASQGGGGSAARFQSAAIRYAQTLRSMSGAPVARPVGTEGGAAALRTGDEKTAPLAADVNQLPEGRNVTVAIGSNRDVASIALINHAVKESLDAMHLKHSVHAMGSTQSPAARTLIEHADRMRTESRRAIDQIVAMNDVGVRATTARAATPKVVDPNLTTSNISNTTNSGVLDDAPTAKPAVPVQVDGSRSTASTPSTTPAAAPVADRGGSVQILAQNAREILDSIDEMSGGRTRSSSVQPANRDGAAPDNQPVAPTPKDNR